MKTKKEKFIKEIFDRGWCWKPFPNYERVVFKRKPEWNYPQSGKWVKVKLVEDK